MDAPIRFGSSCDGADRPAEAIKPHSQLVIRDNEKERTDYQTWN